MINEEKIIEHLIRSTEMGSVPPKGLQEQIFEEIMLKCKKDGVYDPGNSLEKLMFIYPWRIILPASFTVSCIVSLLMGSSFNRFVGAIFGMGGL
ncbi:MAG: hypothetical protein ACM3X7_05750 [Solirubrobacterales bacterium]